MFFLGQSTLDEEKYIVLLSGIELGAETNTNLFKIQMLIDFLNGDFLNNDAENEEEIERSDYEKRMEEILTKTDRVIIAGNSLSSATQSKNMHKQAKYLTKNFVASSVAPIKQLDEFLVQLTGNYCYNFWLILVKLITFGHIWNTTDFIYFFQTIIL